MALQNRELPESIRSVKNTEAATVLLKGTAVKLATTGLLEVLQATADTDVFYGVVMNDIAVGAWGDVMLRGICIAKASADLTRGSKLAVTTAGEFKAAAAGDVIAGLCLGDPAADNDMFEMELCGPANAVSA